MPLTDTAIRKAVPRSKPFKLSDGGGLFLLVQPAGGKWWRYKFRFAGRERLLALGVYPDVSLAEARERHAQARKSVAAGIDPGEQKKEAKRQALVKAENSFEAVAREWHENKRGSWTGRHPETVLKKLEGDLFPKLGARPITDITAPELLAVVRQIEARGALDMARRALQISGQVFRFAIVTGRAERDPSGDLKGALKAVKSQNHVFLREDELPEYLEKLEAYDGSLQTKLALRFLLLTFVRTTELRGATWTEINFDKAEWRIPAERMKMREAHLVPLSTQAVATLRELHALTGQWDHLFPNQHKPAGCMSENTMLYALYRMGYHSRATGHGFRSTASTILNENGFPPDVIERQLAHNERNQVRAAYNHAQYLPERRKMMQWWADFLEGVAKNK